MRGYFMNIEAYNLDSLRKLVRDLEKENKELRRLLDKAEIPYTNKNTFSENIVDLEEYDLDQGGRINSQYIDKQLATKFFSMFWGREDVFAKRAKNGSYYPQCDNRWNNELCPKQRNEKMIMTIVWTAQIKGIIGTPGYGYSFTCIFRISICQSGNRGFIVSATSLNLDDDRLFQLFRVHDFFFRTSGEQSNQS